MSESKKSEKKPAAAVEKDATADKPADAASKDVGDKKKKRRAARQETWATYILKVLKQVSADTGISKRAMSVMCSMVDDVFDRIMRENKIMMRYTQKATLSSREVQTSVSLLFPGELGKHARAEGIKSVTKYTTSKA